MTQPRCTSEDSRSLVLVDAAVQVARSTKAKAVMLYVDAVQDVACAAEKIKQAAELILVARDEADDLRARQHTEKVLHVPDLNLTRMAQIKMAALMAFSQRLLSPGDEFVFLVGVKGRPLDTLVTIAVGRESEIFQSVDQPQLTEHIKRVVFEQVLTIALELAQQGQEGKSVGALFVLGDHREVRKYCQQTIINPFKGYAERARNILNNDMKDTIKEFSTIDGAFVIKGNGVIVSGGTILRPNLCGEPVPAPLGARHSAAAAITASTRSIAITVSQSTGAVRVWRKGQMITEIESAAPTLPSTRNEPRRPNDE